MNKIKNLVNVLAIVAGIEFASGLFQFEINSGLELLIGLVMVVNIIWLTIIVNKED